MDSENFWKTGVSILQYNTIWLYKTDDCWWAVGWSLAGRGWDSCRGRFPAITSWGTEEERTFVNWPALSLSAFVSFHIQHLTRLSNGKKRLRVKSVRKYFTTLMAGFWIPKMIFLSGLFKYNWDWLQYETLSHFLTDRLIFPLWNWVKGGGGGRTLRAVLGLHTRLLGVYMILLDIGK